MPSLPSPLLANGVPTNQGVGGWDAGSSYLSVDEGISAADGVEIGDNSNANGDRLWYATLTDTPGLLDTMDTISVQTRYRVAGAQTNNRSLFVRIETDEATPVLLTNEVTVATNITTTTLTNSAVTAMTIQGTPTKTQWDNAVVRYRLAVVKNKGGDTNGIRMDTFEFTGTYTAAVPSRAETINTGGGISATVTGDHSVAASVRTGGNITTTAVRATYNTSSVRFGLVAGEPYVDALDLYIRWRVSSASLAGAGSQLDWLIYEGETLRANGNFVDVASTSFITSFASLTSGEAASITTWSNLRIAFSFSKAQSSGYGYPEVADVWISVPESVGTPSRTGELNTGGGLTATVTHDASKTGTIRSGGGITATAAKRATRTGTIRTGPNLTAAVAGDHANASVINSGGSITATFTASVSRTGLIRSGGGISVSVANERSTSGTINGGGGIAAATTRTANTSGTLNGGGGITATTTRTVQASVTVNGGGGIAATATGDHTTAVAVNAGANITSTTTGDHSTSGTINGGGRIIPSLGTNVQTSGTISGGGGISATVSSDHTGSGTLNTGGGLSAVVAGDHASGGTINAGGGVDTTTAKRPSLTAQVRGGGQLVSSQGSSRSVAASIRSGANITASATKEGGNPQRAVELNAGGGIAATASPERPTSGSLNTGGGISASVSHAAMASAAVNGGGGVSTQTTGDHAATGLTRGGGGITAAASKSGGWSDLELLLEPADDPLSNYVQSHWVVFSYFSPNTNSARANWWLYSGTTEIASGLLNAVSPSLIGARIGLTPAEVDLITDYSDMRVRLERVPGYEALRVTEVSFEVPFVGVPYTSGTLNTGGNITTAVTGTHVVEAFPSPENAMLGPAMHGGGSIGASVGLPGQRAGLLRTGGGIESTQTTTRSVAASINGGGNIVASTNEFVVAATIYTGGTIIPAITGTHSVSVTVRSGGRISTSSSEGGFNVPGGGVMATLPPATGRPRPRPGSGAILMPGPPGVRPQRNHGDVEH